jgi:hypothetical protein
MRRSGCAGLHQRRVVSKSATAPPVPISKIPVVRIASSW